MDPFLLLILAAGIAIPLIAKAFFHHSICWKEWLLQTVILVAVLGGSFLIAKAGQTSDVRIVNGQVLQKEKDRVSCDHSYQCRCRYTGTGENRRRVCDTCYEHLYDYDWLLRSDVGTIKINRVNRQGTIEPPRFSQAQIGDPVAVRDRWTNYIQGAPHSIYNEKIDIETWRDHIPEYPANVYDYHYVDRVLTTGRLNMDTSAWSRDLADQLKEIHDNVVIVLTDIKAQNYFSALEREWLGGNNNDTVVVLSIDDTTIAQAHAFGWGQHPILYLEIRDALTGKPLERSSVIETITTLVDDHFEAHDDDHFAYLAGEVTLPGWAYGLLLILTLVLSTGTTWYFHKNETFS